MLDVVGIGEQGGHRGELHLRFTRGLIVVLVFLRHRSALETRDAAASARAPSEKRRIDDAGRCQTRQQFVRKTDARAGK